MTLREAEAKLSELDEKIKRLLQEREAVMKEWNTAFYAENQDGTVCMVETIGDVHDLYLVNGESKMHVCHLDSYDMENGISNFYKRIDASVHILNIANKRDYEMPDQQKNLVFAKAVEIRDRVMEKIEE